jgi:hypothetical protein
MEAMRNGATRATPQGDAEGQAKRTDFAAKNILQGDAKATTEESRRTREERKRRARKTPTQALGLDPRTPENVRKTL